MKNRIEKKDSIRIVGVRVKLQNDPEKNSEIISKFLGEVSKSNMLSEICKLTSKTSNSIFRVTEYQDEENIYYYIGVSTYGAVPKKMVELVIPASTWVIFEHTGHYPETTENVYTRFYREWLPFSGYDYVESLDVEIYPISEQKLKGQYSEMWLPIKKSE